LEQEKALENGWGYIQVQIKKADDGLRVDQVGTELEADGCKGRTKIFSFGTTAVD